MNNLSVKSTRFTVSSLTVPVLLLVALVNGLLWSAVLPFDRGNDEKLHLEIAKFIAEEGRLPVFGPGRDFAVYITENGRVRSSYALHPSLPYVIAAVAIRAIPTHTDTDVLHAARLSAVVLGVVTVFLAHLVAQQLFPDNPLLSLALPLFVAFLPQFTFVSSYVNNDAFAIAATSLVIYLTTRQLLLGGKHGWLETLFLGVALGLVLLSKFNAYLIIPFGLSGYTWSLRHTPRKMVAGLGLVCFVALVVGGWWSLRNALLYDGDLLALRTGREAWLTADPTWAPYMALGLDIVALAFLILFWWLQTFITFWAAFGSTEQYVGPHQVTYLGVLLMTFGSFYGLWQGIPKLVCHLGFPQTRPRALTLLGMLLFSISILMLSFASSFFFNAYQPQGRYLFPALVPICVLLLLGLTWISALPIKPQWFVIAGAGFLIALNLLSFFLYLLPGYYPGYEAGLEILQAVTTNNAWFFPELLLVFLTISLIVGVTLLSRSLLVAFQKSRDCVDTL